MSVKLPQLLPHCSYSHFCGICRQREGNGRLFREGALERSGIKCDPDFDCPKGKPWAGWGLGDILAWAIKKMGFTQQAGCGCKARQEWVNKWFPIPKWFQRFLDWVSRLWS